MIVQKEIVLTPKTRGMHLITKEVMQNLELPEVGIAHVFIKHTSAGLLINENADPSVRVDLNTALDRLAPEGEHLYTHTAEGADDMPAHIKATLTGSSVTIPITNGKLNLGTWQGIYLAEFRDHGGARKLIITIYQ